jgi:hypothetical protein
MAYVRLDDQIAHHPKVLRAGAEAAWLWAVSIAYCNRQLTDGHVPAAALSTMGSFRTPPRKLAAALVAVGLFELDGDGYQVHDYLSHNPDKATVQQRMRDAAQRTAASRERRGHALVTPVSQRDSTVTGASSRATRTDSDSDSTPTPSSNDDDTGGASPSQLRIAAIELLALWQQHGTGAPTPQFGKLSFKEKCELRDALRSRSLDECEALFKRAKASDYLSGRDGTFPPMSLWRVLAAAGAIESGEHDNRPRLTKGHRPYGVGVAAPSSSVAVVDPDYNGAPYRFHCQHTPPCTTWPQHRDADAVAS